MSEAHGKTKSELGRTGADPHVDDTRGHPMKTRGTAAGPTGGSSRRSTKGTRTELTVAQQRRRPLAFAVGVVKKFGAAHCRRSWPSMAEITVYAADINVVRSSPPLATRIGAAPLTTADEQVLSSIVLAGKRRPEQYVATGFDEGEQCARECAPPFA